MGLDSTFEKKCSNMLVLDSSARINDSFLTEAFEAAGQQRQAPSTDGTAEQLPPQIEAAACSSIGPKKLDSSEAKAASQQVLQMLDSSFEKKNIIAAQQ